MISNESFDNLHLNRTGLLHDKLLVKFTNNCKEMASNRIECDILEKLKHCYVFAMIFSLIFGYSCMCLVWFCVQL